MDNMTLQLNRIEDAANGNYGDGQQNIARMGLHVVSTLLAKNKDYGDTAQRRPCLAPHVSPPDAIAVRMSDKVARIQNLAKGAMKAQVNESLSDSFLDLAGYAILEVIALAAEYGEDAEAFLIFLEDREQEKADKLEFFEIILQGFADHCRLTKCETMNLIRQDMPTFKETFTESLKPSANSQPTATSV